MDNIINLSRDDIKEKQKERAEKKKVDEIQIPFLLLDQLCFEMERSNSSYITAKDLSVYIADFLESRF